MKKIFIEDETGIVFDRAPKKIINFKTHTIDALPEKMRSDAVKSGIDGFRYIEENPYEFFRLHQNDEELTPKKSTKVTKLPYLYLEFEKGNGWAYPFTAINNPDRRWAPRENPENWNLIAGCGRQTIQEKYFPEASWNLAHFGIEHGIGGEEVIDEFIEYILSQPYWSGKDTSNLIAEVTMIGWPYAKRASLKCWGERDNANREVLEHNWDRICWLPEIRLYTPTYIENSVFERRDSFLEGSFFQSQELRKKLYDTYTNFAEIHSELNEETVNILVHRFIFDHLDYVRSIYDWEF